MFVDYLPYAHQTGAQIVYAYTSTRAKHRFLFIQLWPQCYPRRGLYIVRKTKTDMLYNTVLTISHLRTKQMHNMAHMRTKQVDKLNIFKGKNSITVL